jgi:folate-binding protein YgfZ
MQAKEAAPPVNGLRLLEAFLALPYVSVMTFAAVPLTDRALLRIEGEDRTAFLQGLITNDILLATPQQAMFAAMLSAQGKFQFDFFISADASGFFLETEQSRLAALQRMLTLYKLRSKVTITPRPDAVILAVIGEGVPARFGLPKGEGAATVEILPEGEVTLYTDPRHAALGLRVIASNEATAHAFIQRHGLEMAPIEAYDALRIREGIPEGSKDAAIDRTILLENGYDVLNGISFSKGCYVGQEVTARSKHRAVLRKRICAIAAEGELPASGTPVLAGEREIGEIRSRCGHEGLALIRLDMLRLAEQNEEPVTAAGQPVRIRTLWWHPAETEEASA